MDNIETNDVTYIYYTIFILYVLLLSSGFFFSSLCYLEFLILFHLRYYVHSVVFMKESMKNIFLLCSLPVIRDETWRQVSPDVGPVTS